MACLATLLMACGDDGPTSPAGATRFTALAAGEDHTCALTDGGAIYCWGLNNSGQLGDGTTVDRSEPVRVSATEKFAALSAGNSHTCALTDGGALFCWGRNAEGQLGDGTTTERDLPTSAGGGRAFESISAGGTHTCGLSAAGPFCWGSSYLGQLGTGASGVDAVAPNPTSVGGAFELVGLSAGGLHTCGPTADGVAYCWGSDQYGQLGTAAAETCDDGLGNLAPCSPTPVPISGNERFTALRAGVGHTCGLDLNGAMLCWGRNVEGQLGTGGMEVHTTPTPVSGGHAFVSVTTGLGHTCGLRASGQVLCWGLNHRGQLGDGSTNNRSVPAPVDAGAVPGGRFDALVAGGVHTCGLAAGDIYCWGSNGFGQLGIPDADDTCSGGPCSRTPINVTVRASVARGSSR